MLTLVRATCLVILDQVQVPAEGVQLDLSELHTRGVTALEAEVPVEIVYCAVRVGICQAYSLTSRLHWLSYGRHVAQAGVWPGYQYDAVRVRRLGVAPGGSVNLLMERRAGFMFYMTVINYNKLEYQQRLLANLPAGADLLFMDDRSTDGSYEAAMALLTMNLAKFRSITLIRTAANGHVFDLRLAALEFLAHEPGFFVFLDADDVSTLPTAIVDGFLMQHGPHADVTQFCVRFIGFGQKYNTVVAAYNTPLASGYRVFAPGQLIHRQTAAKRPHYLWGHIFSTNLASPALNDLRPLRLRRISVYDDILVLDRLFAYARTYNFNDVNGYEYYRNTDSIMTTEGGDPRTRARHAAQLEAFFTAVRSEDSLRDAHRHRMRALRNIPKRRRAKVQQETDRIVQEFMMEGPGACDC